MAKDMAEITAALRHGPRRAEMTAASHRRPEKPEMTAVRPYPAGRKGWQARPAVGSRNQDRSREETGNKERSGIISEQIPVNISFRKADHMSGKKIAIVTGASSGMGREMVYLLADHFAALEEIWVVARRKERLEELV